MSVCHDIPLFCVLLLSHSEAKKANMLQRIRQLEDVLHRLSMIPTDATLTTSTTAIASAESDNFEDSFPLGSAETMPHPPSSPTPVGSATLIATPRIKSSFPDPSDDDFTLTMVRLASPPVHTLYGTALRSSDGFTSLLAFEQDHPTTMKGDRLSFVDNFHLPGIRSTNYTINFTMEVRLKKLLLVVVHNDAIEDGQLWQQILAEQNSPTTPERCNKIHVLRDVVRFKLGNKGWAVRFDKNSSLSLVEFESGCRLDHVFAFNDALDADFRASSASSSASIH